MVVPPTKVWVGGVRTKLNASGVEVLVPKPPSIEDARRHTLEVSREIDDVGRDFFVLETHQPLRNRDIRRWRKRSI